MHTNACFDGILKRFEIRTGGLIPRKPSNERKSLSVLNPKIHKALREAASLKEKEQLPKVGDLLDKRDKEMAETAARAAIRNKEKINVYIYERYRGRLERTSTPNHNKVSKEMWTRFLQFRACHVQFNNLKAILLANCGKTVIKNVAYFPKGWKHNPRKPCGCIKTTLLASGKCSYNWIGHEMCRTENLIYRTSWMPTGMNYIGKCQDDIKGRTQIHIQGIKPFFTIQQKFKELETTSTNLSTNLQKLKHQKISCKGNSKSHINPKKKNNLPTTPNSQSTSQGGMSPNNPNVH